MQIDFALFCDYAQVGEMGKITIVGAFDSIGCKELPAKLSRVFLVIGHTAVASDANKPYTVEVECTHDDGGRVFGMHRKGQLGAWADRGSKARLITLVEFTGLEFPKIGYYTINVSLHDGSVVTQWIRVFKAKRKPK